MPRSERLVKLLTLLHSKAGMEADALARACGISERTLRRDLDALTRAGFPVYFDHGYRLAAPALLPPITLTMDEALALRLAAQAAASRPGADPGRALTVATDKLLQALATKPPEDPPERQLALTLPVRDARTEALLATLTAAMEERHSVKLEYIPAARRGPRSHRADPYRLLPFPAGWTLLAYCHDRRRIQRIPVAHLQGATVTRYRFRPVAARLLERHLHRGPIDPSGFHQVRLACRPPLAQALKEHPPVGAFVSEDGPGGSVIFTLVAQQTRDLVPWLLACGDAIEVLEPPALRQEIHRIAQAVTARHATDAAPAHTGGSSTGQGDPQPFKPPS
jgi:predicted DNA-binding transcriptional regulator YafY